MDRSLQISPNGLWTAPANVDAPPGGLARAEEVVIRKKGRLEPRPGFSAADIFTGDTKRLLDFGDDYLSVDPATPTTRWASDNSAVITAVAGAALTWDTYAVKGVESRKNLYITTKDGLRKITSNGSPTAYPTGAPTVHLDVITSVAGDAVLDDTTVVYRALIERTDANGVVTIGGVSNPAGFTNIAGSTQNPTVLVVLHKGGATGAVGSYLAGDVVKVYRTLGSPIPETPFDEEFLVRSVTLTAGYISDGYFTFQDSVQDGAVQEALYTNENQEGLTASHVTPPRAKSVALFNGSLFLADLTFYPQEAVAYTYETDRTGITSGIGLRLDASVGMTNGSAVCTSVLTTGLKVGMIVLCTTATGSFTAPSTWVRIASIDSSTQITLTDTWAGTTGNKALIFSDSLRIGSLYFPTGFGGQTLVNFIRGVPDYYLNSTDFQFVPSTTVSTLASAELLNLEDNYANAYGFREIVLQGLDLTTAVTVWATHGSEWSPVLPEPSESTGHTLAQSILPSAFMWSDTLQPEHFKAQNIDYAGHQLTRIMSIQSLKNALLLFKEDYLFRVSGAGESSGFRLDQLSSEVRLLYPDAAASMGEKAYAWCDQGVYECDENGVLNISHPAIADRLSEIQKLIKAGSSTAHGVWSTVNVKDREFILSVPTTADTTVGDKLYVFNVNQGSWVNWFIDRDLNHGMYKADLGQVILQEGSLTWTERAISTLYTLDREYAAVSITNISGLVVTIAAASGWTPAVGDVLVRSGTVSRVTAITSATIFTVDVAPPSTGTASGYVSFTSVVQFIGNVAKNPYVLKMFGEGSVGWEDTNGLSSYVIAFTSSISTNSVSQTRTISDLPITGTPAETYRFTTPKRHARCTRLYPAITVRQGGAIWALSGLSVGYRLMSDRVRNR